MAQKRRLTDVSGDEISIVDKGAIRKKYFIVKNEDKQGDIMDKTDDDKTEVSLNKKDHDLLTSINDNMVKLSEKLDNKIVTKTATDDGDKDVSEAKSAILAGIEEGMKEVKK